MKNGMLGMDIARIYCFLLFHSHQHANFPMWMVSPSFLKDGSHNLSVVHVDSIVHTAHLLPIFSNEPVPAHITFHNSLDIY